MWKLKHQRASRGFTHIELLVTIGIIGILAGIGVVTVGKLRATSQQTQCVNNLRRISQGPQSYYNDFRVFPDDGYTDDGDLFPLSTELANYTTTKSTFVCPTDNDPTSTGNFASYGDPYYVSRKNSYGTDEQRLGSRQGRILKLPTGSSSGDRRQSK